MSDGILMFWRWSIGWNLHRSREIKTVALPLAVTYATGCGGRRLVFTVGPVTLVWLLGSPADGV